MDLKKNQEEFISLYNENIKREGAEELLKYLLTTDFFTAPASTRFHSAEDGGLCLHSLNAYNRLLENIKKEYGEEWEEKVSLETITICSLLHDVCKANFYKTEMRNTKIDGVWEQVPYYSVDDQLPYGHGEKSVYIINGFMRLSREEALAINWHMGACDARAKGGSNTWSQAFYQYPLAFMFHISDMEATYLDEEKPE